MIYSNHPCPHFITEIIIFSEPSSGGRGVKVLWLDSRFILVLIVMISKKSLCPLKAFSNSGSIPFLFHSIAFHPTSLHSHFPFQFWPLVFEVSQFLNKLTDFAVVGVNRLHFTNYMIHVKISKIGKEKAELCGVKDLCFFCTPYCNSKFAF